MYFHSTTQSTEKLAYLSGVLIGDGSISARTNKNEYCIKCVGNPRDEIEYYNLIIAPLFYDLFGKHVKPKYHDSKTTYGVSVYSKKIVLFLSEFLDIPIGRKNSLKVPKPFSGNCLFSHFLRGLFDTDGCITFKKRYTNTPYYPTISISSIDENLLGQVKTYMHNNGFKVNFYRNTKIMDNRFKKGFSRISRIELNGFENLSKWMNLIGTSHPKNIKKIKLYWKGNSGGWTFRRPHF